jgi:rubrerythrin
LVRSALQRQLLSEVIAMERDHNRNFEEMVAKVTQYGFMEEFMEAVREEDIALQKVIEAYDKRMEGRV